MKAGWIAVLLAASLHAAESPSLQPRVREGDWSSASLVLERWIRVQGLDRPSEALYPRDAAFTAKWGNAPQETKVRFIDRGDKAYWLAIQGPDGRRHGELARTPAAHWLISEQYGIGQIYGESLWATLLRGLRMDAATLRTRYASWRRLKDEVVEGRPYQGVLLRKRPGEYETWWFDPEKGVRVGVAEFAGEAVFHRIRYGDFREVDGVLEPFEMYDEENGRSVTLRLVKLAHKVSLPRTFFEPTTAQFQMWTQTQQILESYVKAAGGIAALSRVVSRVTKSDATVEPGGGSFRQTLTQRAAPNRFVAEYDVPGIGRTWIGHDGESGWEYSDLKGFRKMNRWEAELMLRGSMLDTENFFKKYPVRLLNGTQVVNGRKTAAMVLTSPKYEQSGTHYFDLETHQLVRIETVAGGAEATQTVTIDFSDFRTVDAVTMPFQTTIATPAQRTVIKVQSVEQNVPLDDAIFRPRKDP